MSGFFPWNFCGGTGGEGSIPATGCPLEKHPNWFIEAGPEPSGLCWETSNGRTVSVASEDDIVRNIAFRSAKFQDGLVSAKIVTISTAANDWMLPLCARMIDPSNLIGARWIDGKFEVVQRAGGTWTTLFSGGPVPAVDDVVKLVLVGGNFRLTVNGAIVNEDAHGLPDSEGFWGLSTHRATSFVGNTLFSEFYIVNADNVLVTHNSVPVTINGAPIYHL
jgi:hypothetical protein